MIQATNFADTHKNITLTKTCIEAKIDWHLLSILRFLNNNDFFNLTRVDKWHHLQGVRISSVANYTTLNPLIARKLNLSHSATIKQYVADEFQSNPYIDSAVKIAKRLYETGDRFVANGRGNIYSMNPEILASCMRDAKSGIALEIAGGAGENAILLAYSNFDQVYYNDVENSEVAIFKELKKQLPTNVNKKLKEIEGSYQDILKINPEIEGKVSLILCRNFIHFLHSEGKKEFFKLIDRILKVGGKAIFTANSIYGKGQTEYFKANPNSLYFKLTRAAVADLDNLSNSGLFYENWKTSTEGTSTEGNGGDTQILFACSEETKSKWFADPETAKQFDISECINIRERLNKTSCSNIKNGIVKVFTGTTQLYSKGNFQSIFENNGFNVESIFVFSNKGHLLNSNEYFENGEQIGAIVSKKSERL